MLLHLGKGCITSTTPPIVPRIWCYFRHQRCREDLLSGGTDRRQPSTARQGDPIQVDDSGKHLKTPLPCHGLIPTSHLQPTVVVHLFPSGSENMQVTVWIRSKRAWSSCWEGLPWSSGCWDRISMVPRRKREVVVGPFGSGGRRWRSFKE